MPFPALAIAPILLAAAPAAAETDRLILAELAARPAATAADLYKLLHQSVFGPGHLIKDVDAARAYLQQEMAGLTATQPGERLQEELGAGLVRVNLRPFRDAQGSADRLLQAMLATAQNLRGERRELEARLDNACRLLERGDRGGLATELRTLAAVQAAKGHPPLHHSKAYHAAYRPAYRVVRARYLSAGALQP